MIRTQIYLPDDLYQELKFLAVTGKKNLSELIREGANLVVKKSHVQKKDFGKGFIGAIKGGPKDLSSKIDYYLYDEPYRNKKARRK